LLTQFTNFAGGKLDVFNIIHPVALANQERALITFEAFLKPSSRAKLHVAWLKYSSGPHTSAPGSSDKRPHDIARAQANLELLLQCAQAK